MCFAYLLFAPFHPQKGHSFRGSGWPFIDILPPPRSRYRLRCRSRARFFDRNPCVVRSFAWSLSANEPRNQAEGAYTVGRGNPTTFYRVGPRTGYGPRPMRSVANTGTVEQSPLAEAFDPDGSGPFDLLGTYVQ